MKKYKLDEGLESLDRVKLLMSYKNDMTLTENEEKIKGLLNEIGPFAVPAAAALFKWISASAIGAGITSQIINKQLNVFPDTKDELQSWYDLGEEAENGGVEMTPDFDASKEADKFYKGTQGFFGLGYDEDEEAMVEAINACETFVDFYNLCKEYNFNYRRNLIDDFVKYTEKQDFLALRKLRKLKEELNKAKKVNNWPPCVAKFETKKDSDGVEYKLGTDGLFYYKDFKVINPNKNEINTYRC